MVRTVRGCVFCDTGLHWRPCVPVFHVKRHLRVAAPALLVVPCGRATFPRRQSARCARRGRPWRAPARACQALRRLRGDCVLMTTNVLLLPSATIVVCAGVRRIASAVGWPLSGRCPVRGQNSEVGHGSDATRPGHTLARLMIELSRLDRCPSDRVQSPVLATASENGSRAVSERHTRTILMHCSGKAALHPSVRRHTPWLTAAHHSDDAAVPTMTSWNRRYHDATDSGARSPEACPRHASPAGRPCSTCPGSTRPGVR